MKNYLFFICLIFFSCQEEITLDLPQVESKLVVEGAIEAGFPPYVILTRNQGYFEVINTDTYNNLFVTDALVSVIRDDGIKHELTLITENILSQIEMLLDTNINIPPNTIYIDLEELINPNNFSVTKRSYYLDISWNNQIITAETTIPEPTPLDCLWVEKSETTEKDFKYDIRAVYSDPGDIQNNVLIRSKRLEHWKRDTINGEIKNNNDPQLILIDAGPDILINGESFETYFPRPKEEGGVPSGSYNASHYKIFDNNGTEDTVFLPHDIVLIKFCQIDESSLKFWRSVVRQFTTNGNPFSEPMNLVGNINNGLGGWTGYGAVYYKVPVIKDTIIKQQYTPEILDIF